MAQITFMGFTQSENITLPALVSSIYAKMFANDKFTINQFSSAQMCYVGDWYSVVFLWRIIRVLFRDY